VDVPQWLQDLMDLLDLDIVEQANWIRRWNGPSDSRPALLNAGRLWRAKTFFKNDHDLVEELIRRGLVGEREVLQAKAMASGLGFVDLERVQIEPSAFTDVPPDLVTRTRSIPVKRDGGTLFVVVSSSNDSAAIDAFKEATGCRIVPVFAVSAAINEAIEKYFPEGG